MSQNNSGICGDFLERRKQIIARVERKPFKKKMLTGFWIPAFNEMIVDMRLAEFAFPCKGLFPVPVKWTIKKYNQVNSVIFLVNLILQDVGIYQVDNPYSYAFAKCILTIIFDGVHARVIQRCRTRSVKVINAFLKYHILDRDIYQIDHDGNDIITEPEKFLVINHIQAILKEFYIKQPTFKFPDAKTKPEGTKPEETEHKRTSVKIKRRRGDVIEFVGNGCRFMEFSQKRGAVYIMLWPKIREIYDEYFAEKLCSTQARSGQFARSASSGARSDSTDYFRYDTQKFQHIEKIYVDQHCVVFEKNGRIFRIQKDITKTCLWHRNYKVENLMDDPPNGLCMCQVCKWCNKTVDSYGGPKKVVCPECM